MMYLASTPGTVASAIGAMPDVVQTAELVTDWQDVICLGSDHRDWRSDPYVSFGTIELSEDAALELKHLVDQPLHVIVRFQDREIAGTVTNLHWEAGEDRTPMSASFEMRDVTIRFGGVLEFASGEVTDASDPFVPVTGWIGPVAVDRDAIAGLWKPWEA
jgi:hypothetical protein